MSIKIGPVELKNNIFLAPMAGITDRTFRGICAQYGCGLTYTEMVSAKGLLYDNKNTQTLLDIHENEETVAVQLFGSDAAVMAKMAEKISRYEIDIIDINMGCPANKIVKNGEGSALMREPEKIGEIVKAVSSAIKKPLTVKIRKGFYDDCINAVEVAKIIEDNGAAAVCVHGRTREQYYSGKADWDIIAKVKEAVSIPVIGNGDVVDAPTCRQMMNHTNCDAVMVGRAAQGNPWVFKEIAAFLETGVIPPKPDCEEKIRTALYHTKEAIKHKGDYIGIREMRKHLGCYVRGMEGAAELRVRINQLQTYEDIEDMFHRYMDGRKIG